MDQPFNQADLLEANISVELTSSPCPLCGKKFPNEDQLTRHAATCNYMILRIINHASAMYFYNAT